MPIIIPPGGPEFNDRTFSSTLTESFGNDFDATTYHEQASRWINDCLRLLARSSHIPLSDLTTNPTVVAGTATYVLPDRFVRVVEVWDTSTHVPLSEVTQTWIDAQPESSGTPEVYALQGNSLVLYPTPAAATPIQVRYIESTIGLEGGEPITGIIPDEYGDVLVTYVRWHLFRAEDDIDMAAFWEAQHNSAFLRLKADLQKRGTTTRQVPGMWRSEARPRFVRPA